MSSYIHNQWLGGFMAHSGVLCEIPNVLNGETLTVLPAGSSDPVVADLDPTEAAAIQDSPVERGSTVEPAAKRGLRSRLHKAAAAVVIFAGTLLAGESRAEATSLGAIPAQAQPQESGFDWSLIPLTATAISASIGVVAFLHHRRDRTTERFYAILKDIEAESTGEERLARLDMLMPFAERREYKPKVLRASVAYLRGRRSGLIKLKQEYPEPSKLEAAITERRNPDRTAFKLFLATLPVARRQMHRQETAKRITRFIKIAHSGDAELVLQRIDKLTGLKVDKEKPRVDARGINLDDMRGEVQSCNLTDVDLTGAGLQRNDIKRVSFEGARLCEAQLEGSQLSHCSLEGADLRAAYFGENDPETKKDPDYTIIEECVIDTDTKFGNLPNTHPNARMGKLDPSNPEKYRGSPNVILKDLRSDTLSDDQIIQKVHEWQRNGLVLQPGSNPEYFLNAED